MQVIHGIQTQVLWWEHPFICHYNRSTTASHPAPSPKPCCRCCSVCWLTGTGSPSLPSASPAKLAAFGVCRLPGHISVAAAHFLSCAGRKECSLHQNFKKMILKHNLLFLLLFPSREQNTATQTPSTISRVFTCLDRIVHLTQTSIKPSMSTVSVYLEIW